MAKMTISQPTTYLFDITLKTPGTGLVTQCASATQTTLYFSNYPGLVVLAVNLGVTGTTITFQNAAGTTATAATCVASDTVLFGPFAPGIYNDSSGYVTATLSQTSSVKVGTFLLAPTGMAYFLTGPAHNMFQTLPVGGDY